MNTGDTASQYNALTPCRNYFGSSLHPAEVLSATSSRYRASFGQERPAVPYLSFLWEHQALTLSRYSWRSAGSALTTPGDISVEFSKSVQQQLQGATVATANTDAVHLGGRLVLRPSNLIIANRKLSLVLAGKNW